MRRENSSFPLTWAFPDQTERSKVNFLEASSQGCCAPWCPPQKEAARTCIAVLRLDRTSDDLSHCCDKITCQKKADGGGAQGGFILAHGVRG